MTRLVTTEPEGALTMRGLDKDQLAKDYGAELPECISEEERAELIAEFLREPTPEERQAVNRYAVEFFQGG